MSNANELLYIVADPSFWNRISATRELTCGRVRFTNGRVTLNMQGMSFPTKGHAVQHMVDGQILVRETRLSENSWHYQLLLGRIDRKEY